jgi:hypothetical protein
MQSESKFVELAKTIARRKRPMFDSLIEFERTKKLRTKERLNFSIDKSIVADFKNFCKSHGYNMSALIEKSMKDMVNKKV